MNQKAAYSKAAFLFGVESVKKVLLRLVYWKTASMSRKESVIQTMIEELSKDESE